MRHAVTILVAIALSCTIDRPSEQLECGTNGECTPGRKCEGGLCVLATGSGNCDPDTGECFFDCTSSDPANCMKIACPVGFRCRIDCGGSSACGEIVCQNNATCDIECTGTSACGTVTCRPGATCNLACTGTTACALIQCEAGGACDVTCDGNEACGPVDCIGACACDVSCSNDGECGAMTCPLGLGGACTDARGVCDSSDAGCNTCLP